MNNLNIKIGEIICKTKHPISVEIYPLSTNIESDKLKISNIGR